MAFEAIRRIVVAGGSLAGYSAVSELLAADYAGEILWVTGEKEGSYSKPALSKEFIQGKSDYSELFLPEIADSRGNLRILRDIQLRSLDAAARTAKLEDGRSIDFDGLVVCTGAVARMPAITRGMAGVLGLRTLEDALAIKAELAGKPRIAILGGGLIGCELAASMRSFGLEITLIEGAPTLLGRTFGAVLGEYVLDMHQRNGVDVMTGVTIEELIARDGRVAAARLSDGSVIETDLVLVGAGSIPATEWLEGSGLKLADGVVCDATLASSHPGIYAAGDVARWHNPFYDTVMRVEHWTSASAQGRAAARNLLHSLPGSGEEPVPFADVPYFWSDQYGLKLQMVGRHDGHDHVERQETADRTHPLLTFHREGQLVAAAGVNASRAVMRYRKQIEDDARSRQRVAEPC
ncbi:NAD(P)/FAD-dependent oxidoreductase [Kaistia granuli]|uniref:NAD(P)/FAD-dependent oxidoreductase n=1 Tax=Kaistia granuli TaxID=363259 RepID=UPI0003666FB9|nr:FAD-dependent oxidoreductase [Kaistia granuli]